MDHVSVGECRAVTALETVWLTLLVIAGALDRYDVLHDIEW
jgi:hypothetical protein